MNRSHRKWLSFCCFFFFSFSAYDYYGGGGGGGGSGGYDYYGMPPAKRGPDGVSNWSATSALWDIVNWH